MFYYAEIDSDYGVVAIHSLTVASTNENYIAITEEQYTSGDLVGKYYNSLHDRFEIINMMDYMGNSDFVTHYDTKMQLSTKIDNMQKEIYGKADDDHTHSDYATTDHTHSNYAVTDHTHSDYAATTHTHSDYATTTHTHSEYATTSHTHSNYAALSHTHDEYANASHTHTEYANASHTHDDRYFTEAEVNTKLATKADATHTHDSAYDAIGSAASALASAKVYTDAAIDDVNDTVATKANASALTSHTGNTTVHITSTERTNWNAAKSHADTAHAPANAEENQNAFSNIAVNGTVISADAKSDTLTLVAGSNVTITPDATGDSITISSANTVYSHPTTSGNKHIPSGGSSGQILRWGADGTAVWGSDNNTTYSNATSTASGLMSNTDKTKLDGIAEGANNYVLPSAGTSLGGVKTGGDVTISAGVITVNDDSHNHTIANVDGLQSALDAKATSSHTHNDVYYTETEIDTMMSGKADTTHGTHVSYSTTAPVMDGTASVGTATTVARSDHKHPVDTSRAAQSDLTAHTGNQSNPHGVTLAQLGVTATATELNYVDGVTSNIQTQLNAKADSSHTHDYAASSHTHDYAASSHTHTAEALVAMASALFGTGYTGGVEYSYGADSGKNILTEISNMPQGMHTAYVIAGTTGNPETTDSYRYFIHKTSTTIGWILAFAADGSIYSNYLAGADTFKGWRAIYDNKRKPLWTGSYYMTAGHTATPSKKLSECAHGWLLLWSDYDSDTTTVNNTDFCTTMIPNRSWAGATWNGSSFYCDVPAYSAGSATGSEQRVIKLLSVYDNKLVGTEHNSVAPRNDVVLRAVYEF